MSHDSEINSIIQEINRLFRLSISTSPRFGIKNPETLLKTYVQIRRLKPHLDEIDHHALAYLGWEIQAIVSAETNYVADQVKMLRQAHPKTDIVTLLRTRPIVELNEKLHIIERTSYRLLQKIRDLGVIVPEIYE